jgi:tetratricopeptide (TPR) repeat protein
MRAANSHPFSPTGTLIRRFFCCLALGFIVTRAVADDSAFNHLLGQGEQAGNSGELPVAMKYYSTGEQWAAGNVTNWCGLTKAYCNLMRDTQSPAMQKLLAQKALASAQAAKKADPRNAVAHVCLAICYAKNFPYVGNQTRVIYSRLIKTESERAIELDPRQDIAYYLLGRWNYGVANLNFIYKGLVRIIYGGLPFASNAQAIKDLQQAAGINPARIIHHEELARVYAAIGQKKLAREELETCARLKPLDPDDADAQSDAAKELSDLSN